LVPFALDDKAAWDNVATLPEHKTALESDELRQWLHYLAHTSIKDGKVEMPPELRTHRIFRKSAWMAERLVRTGGFTSGWSENEMDDLVLRKEREKEEAVAKVRAASAEAVAKMRAASAERVRAAAERERAATERERAASAERVRAAAERERAATEREAALRAELERLKTSG
jgi:hypothetical protein